MTKKEIEEKFENWWSEFPLPSYDQKVNRYIKKTARVSYMYGYIKWYYDSEKEKGLEEAEYFASLLKKYD